MSAMQKSKQKSPDIMPRALGGYKNPSNKVITLLYQCTFIHSMLLQLIIAQFIDVHKKNPRLGEA